MRREEATQEEYYELLYYTLAHRDPSFIHQNVVDAYAAQCADATDKPMKIAFALIGLYLHIEEGYSGRQVQRAHMRLAKRRKQWPRFTIPEQRGAVTVSDVVAVPPSPERDVAIERWCRSVWEAWRGSREPARELLEAELK